MRFEYKDSQKHAKTPRRDIEIPFCHNIADRYNVHNGYQRNECPQNKKGYFLLPVPKPQGNSYDTNQQNNGEVKRRPYCGSFRYNMIICVKNDRKEQDFNIRGYDFRHGKDIRYHAIPGIRHMLNRISQKYKPEKDVNTTHE